MSEGTQSLKELRRRHPIFFWGSSLVLLLLLVGSAIMMVRVPYYRSDAALLDERMSETERETRDRILDSRSRRAQLALALIQREMRIKSMEEKGIHLALSTEDSMLYLRHGPATLRQARVEIGPDSVIDAPDGRTWRFVRALGERHLADKEQDPTYTIPEWVYVGQGMAVPEESQRRVRGALGKYLLTLDDGTEIYSRPETGPFVEGAKPASYAVAERDLQAIFDAIGVDAPVYIY